MTFIVASNSHSSHCIFAEDELGAFSRAGGYTMADGHGSQPMPIRSWREIAEQLAREHDSVRILALSEELMRALDLEKKANRKSA
jgi:hypothetical protein